MHWHAFQKQSYLHGLKRKLQIKKEKKATQNRKKKLQICVNTYRVKGQKQVLKRCLSVIYVFSTNASQSCLCSHKILHKIETIHSLIHITGKSPQNKGYWIKIKKKKTSKVLKYNTNQLIQVTKIKQKNISILLGNCLASLSVNYTQETWIK